jgi:uncharacterized protein (TIGR02118 family)
MINVAILHPRTAGARFDVDYYLDRHMPLSVELLRSHPGFRSVSVEIAIGSAVPGTDAALVAMCLYLFESIDAFVEAFTAHQARPQTDVAAYADIEPVIQFNEVALAA